MASLLPSVDFRYLVLLNNVEASGLQTQNISPFNATQSVTADDAALKMPTNRSSLITFIFSFSALRDYLKLIVLGGALGTLRRLSSASYASLMDRFFITATFQVESEDLSFGGHSFLFATGHTIDQGYQNG